MIVRWDHDVVAELGGVEKAASEARDQGECETAEKCEQICKRPGHSVIIGTSAAEFGIRNSEYGIATRPAVANLRTSVGKKSLVSLLKLLV